MKNRKFKLTFNLGIDSNPQRVDQVIEELKNTLGDFFSADNIAFDIEETTGNDETEELLKKITIPAPRNNTTTI